MDGSIPPQEPRAPAPERLRQIVDALDEGVAILDADGVVEFVNPRGQEILGVPALEVVGHPLLAFDWETVGPDGVPIPREHHPALRVLETGLAQPRIVLGMRSTMFEGIRWIEVTSVPLTAEDAARPGGSLSTFRDVSERVAASNALAGSERRFEVLADAIPVGVFHAVEGRCVWTNAAWAHISGRSIEASLGKGWEQAVHPDDLPRVRSEWDAAAARGEPFELEHRIRRPDGAVRWVLCRVTAVTPDKDAPRGFLGSVVDVTDAREAGELKDQIIGQVSHELRAPLVSIRGALTFLEPHLDAQEPEVGRLYDMAVRNTVLLERLVRDLLDIERLEGGTAALEMDDQAVAPVLDEAWAIAAGLAEERGVVLEPLPNVEAHARFDRDRILQVLTNLTTNAVKFSEPGDRVRLDLRLKDDYILFAVVDEGRGIPADQTGRIFERFVQVLPSDGAERGGVGLGLAIARAIAVRHGGRIWVESTEGEGSTFFFKLPTA